MATAPSASQQGKTPKARELQTCTLRASLFAYAQLALVTEAPNSTAVLDALQVRSYCTAALRQFLGDTGVAIAVDILRVEGREAWVRVPQPDLSAFAAALVAFGGVVDQGVPSILQIRACGDWLGSLLGVSKQQKLWES